MKNCAALLSISVFILASSMADYNKPIGVAAVDMQRIINADREPQNWLAHGRTYDEQRFSPLTTINADNVSELGLAWYLDLGTDRGQEATPIVVDGVIYVSGAWNIVYAIDARSGELLWQHNPETSRVWVAEYAVHDAVSRGLAVWDGKVIAATLDGRLFALDARNGELLWSVLTIDRSKPYSITGAPRIVKGRVIIGNSGADYGVRGYVSAYDASNGELDWRFYTVPGDPSQPQESAALERAVKTWTGEEWYKTGGGGTVWNSMAFDPELNLLYFGVGNGTPWSRELRSPGGGDNLFLSSILAVNPDNGEYVWHYQTTPGESWNFSAVESIILADIEVEGQPRKVLIQAPKNGFFYVLDRATGELLSAQQYIEQNWASHIDMATGRPVEYPFARYKNQGRLIVPGPSGGHSWYPMSYSPHTQLAYIPALSVPGYYNHDEAYTYKPGFQNKGIEEGVTDYRALNPQGNRQILRFGTRLLAWDPKTQTERWRVEHADLPGGTLVTIGNLVFQGLGSGEFVAFAADTGMKLWNFEVGTTIMAGPVTYAVDGEQYVAVMAGRPRAMHCRMIFFWRMGSSSRRHSLPRSPRATITAPDASMIADRFEIAARVSTLATTRGPSGWGSTGNLSRSSADLTKESATMSMSSSRKRSRADRSSSVGAPRDRRSEGTCTPGRPVSRPPCITRASSRSALQSRTSRMTRPSPMLRRSPGSTSSSRPA